MTEELERLTRALVQLYFVHRDYGAILRHLAPDVTWIGGGRAETGCGLDEARALFEQEKRARRERLWIEGERYRTVHVSEHAALVLALVELTGEPETGPRTQLCLRLSIVYRRTGGQWLAAHLHASLPCPRQGAAPGLNAEAGRRDLELLEREVKRQVGEASRRDPLTGIYNMEGFAQKAGEACRGTAGRCYAFIKFGINNFRYINQVYGFDLGDEVLRNIAKNLESFCREGEACGRVEKDIFALLLVCKSTQELSRRMERLLPRLLDEQMKKRVGSEITFAAGAYLPGDPAAEPVKDMLDKALIAMESREGEGRRNKLFFYDAPMAERRLWERRLMEQAAGALEQGEFRLFIQPQIVLATGEPAGGEALVRWQRPDGTVLQPDEFIPLFEHNEFVLQFDFYMLETLCRQLRAWLDAGLSVKPISINQSRRHLCDEHYLENFCAVVDRWRVPHGYIVFELTEGAFVEYGSETMALARRLHQQGFLLAIDDFGTGYASLHSVSRMAADILKIDRSLLENFETNPRGRVILQKVVEMARETQMLSVCEGVETPGQEAYLKGLGCDWAQGFLYARPMPAAAFEQRYLRRG